VGALPVSTPQVQVPGDLAPRFSVHSRRRLEQSNLDEAVEGLMKWHCILAIQEGKLLIQVQVPLRPARDHRYQA